MSAEAVRRMRDLHLEDAIAEALGLEFVDAGADWVYPLVVGLVLLAIMPAMWSRLFTEPVGQIQLAAALGLQVLGFLAIRRALRVDY